LPVLPEKTTREELFAASLHHEMKTPLAALSAVSENLRRHLGALLRQIAEQAPGSEPISALLPILKEAIADPAPEPPLTGLAHQQRAAAAAVRLRAAGMKAGADEASSILVRGGWESRFDVIAPLLVRWGSDPLSGLLDSVGRLRGSLRSLDASVARLTNLTAALRIGLGAPNPVAEVFELLPCVEAAMGTLHHVLRENVGVDVRCPAGMVLIGNSVHISQIVTNLVANALAALPAAGGQVTLEAERSGDTVIMRVIDNGAGVPDAIHDRLFTPFFTTRATGQGTGVGLYISRRIAETHGGTLAFESRPGRTCFELRLPAAPAGRATSDGGS